MNITQIKYVLEVARSSSIREAATKLFISQPALSASIKELEEELGILIFERTNKGITVTDSGREFLNYAKKAAAQYEILEDRYLSRDRGKEHFSVSAQHYNIAIRAFSEVIRPPIVYNYTCIQVSTYPAPIVYNLVLILELDYSQNISIIIL